MFIFAILFIGMFGFAAIAISGLLMNQPEKSPKGAETWPSTEGTVKGSGMANVSRYDQLPWFDFSYVVDGEYYSGTFMLAAEGDRASELLREMDEKKFSYAMIQLARRGSSLQRKPSKAVK